LMATVAIITLLAVRHYAAFPKSLGPWHGSQGRCTVPCHSHRRPSGKDDTCPIPTYAAGRFNYRS
jgi:hypothetical protein